MHIELSQSTFVVLVSSSKAPTTYILNLPFEQLTAPINLYQILTRSKANISKTNSYLFVSQVSSSDEIP